MTVALPAGQSTPVTLTKAFAAKQLHIFNRRSPRIDQQLNEWMVVFTVHARPFVIKYCARCETSKRALANRARIHPLFCIKIWSLWIKYVPTRHHDGHVKRKIRRTKSRKTESRQNRIIISNSLLNNDYILYLNIPNKVISTHAQGTNYSFFQCITRYWY